MGNILLTLDVHFLTGIIDYVDFTFPFSQRLLRAYCRSDTVLGCGRVKVSETQFLSWKSL